MHFIATQKKKKNTTAVAIRNGIYGNNEQWNIMETVYYVSKVSTRNWCISTF